MGWRGEHVVTKLGQCSVLADINVSRDHTLISFDSLSPQRWLLID